MKTQNTPRRMPMLEDLQKINEKHEDGPFEDKWTNGNIRSKGTYKNGELDGKYEEYNETGIKIIETEYSNGQKNGKEIEYNDDGSLYMESEFKNNKRNGITKRYTDNIVTSEETYVDGKLTSKTNYKKA